MDTNALEDILVSKFKIKGKAIYIKLLWKQNEHELFEINIFDGDLNWSGRYSNDFAEKYRERVDENYENYCSDVKKCLQTFNTDFIYDFTPAQSDSNSTATFSWKKKLEGVVVVHGSVPVHRSEISESKDTLIDFLMLQNNELKQTVAEYDRKNENLSGVLEKCKSELEQFVNSKSSLETSLYTKFVQLLNAKKRRIQLLEQNLLKFEANQSSANDNELN